MQRKSEFADGFLHIVNSSDFTELYTYENVTAFDLTDTGAAFVSFFTNDKNEADEAAVIWARNRNQPTRSCHFEAIQRRLQIY